MVDSDRVAVDFAAHRADCYLQEESVALADDPVECQEEESVALDDDHVDCHEESVALLARGVRRRCTSCSIGPYRA